MRVCVCVRACVRVTCLCFHAHTPALTGGGARVHDCVRDTTCTGMSVVLIEITQSTASNTISKTRLTQSDSTPQ